VVNWSSVRFFFERCGCACVGNRYFQLVEVNIFDQRNFNFSKVIYRQIGCLRNIIRYDFDLFLLLCLIINIAEMSRYCYCFYVNLPLCVYRLSSLIQNLLHRHRKDLLIVQLPAEINIMIYIYKYWVIVYTF